MQCQNRSNSHSFSASLSSWPVNLLILCAGYAQRMLGVGNGIPKALLSVRGAPMLDHVLSRTADYPTLQTVTVVTNAAHHEQFKEWQKNSARCRNSQVPVKLLNDGSTSAVDKLGAIGDLSFAIGAGRLLDDDLVVVAGDTLFSASQSGFIGRSRGKPCTIGTFDTGSLDAVKKIASLSTDNEGRITDFEEKPQRPTSTVGGVALYYFRRDTIQLIDQYMVEGNNPDQAGHLIAWLTQRIAVYGIPIEGDWLDIGTPEAYSLAHSDPN